MGEAKRARKGGGEPAAAGGGAATAVKSGKQQQDVLEKQAALDEANLGMLSETQEELEQINDKSSDEVLAVEMKWNAVKKPLYQKRNEIIRNIPEFWLTAFACHPVLGDLLLDEDHQILSYLEELIVDESPDMSSGYKITMKFREDNPYFEDRELFKEVRYSDSGEPETVGTKPQWRPGKVATALWCFGGCCHDILLSKYVGPCLQDITKPPDDFKGNKRAYSQLSFFSWFTRGLRKGDEDEIADIIKDDLWQDPLKYYNAAIEYGEEQPEGSDHTDEDSDGVEAIEGSEDEEDGSDEGEPDDESDGDDKELDET
eukprot:jgi/Chlat1/5162/Chrsp33S05037